MGYYKQNRTCDDMTRNICCGRYRSWYWPRGRRIEVNKKSNNIIPHYGLVLYSYILHMTQTTAMVFVIKYYVGATSTYIYTFLELCCLHYWPKMWTRVFCWKRISYANVYDEIVSFVFYVISLYWWGEKYYVFTDARPKR